MIMSMDVITLLINLIRSILNYVQVVCEYQFVAAFEFVA